MDPYTYNNNRDLEHSSGRSVIPRRLPPVPSLPSLETRPSWSSPPSSPPSSVFSLSPPSSSASSPASSPGSASPDHSPTKVLNALKRISRPLPEIPGKRDTSSSGLSQPLHSTRAQLIVCRSCMNCVATSEGLLPASAVSIPTKQPLIPLGCFRPPLFSRSLFRSTSNCKCGAFDIGPSGDLTSLDLDPDLIVTSYILMARCSQVPPGSRPFRGFLGKASLFTECYNVRTTAPRVQLMTTGAHTMQETFCANCSTYLGWKIVKARERSERWKEGNWFLELENLWLAKSSDVLDSSFDLAVEREREWEREREKEREMTNQPRVRRGSEFGLAAEGFPKDALKLVRAARELGLGLEFADSEDRTVKGPAKPYLQASGKHHYSRSTPSFGAYGSGSAVHLPTTVAAS